MKNLIRAVLVCVLTISPIVVSNAMGQFMAFQNPLLGETAQDFTLRSLSGEEVNFEEFRSGQPAILFFWATWCPHCRTELRELADRKSDLEGKGVKLVLIDLEENEDTIRSYLERNNIEIDVLLDENSAVAGQYSIMGVPTYFLIDAEGIVRAVEHVFPESFKDYLG